jgi:hypothetical protein
LSVSVASTIAVSNTKNYAGRPRIAGSWDSHFLVVWSELDKYDKKDRIYGRRLTPTNTASWITQLGSDWWNPYFLTYLGGVQPDVGFGHVGGTPVWHFVWAYKTADYATMNIAASYWNRDNNQVSLHPIKLGSSQHVERSPNLPQRTAHNGFMLAWQYDYSARTPGGHTLNANIWGACLGCNATP